MHFLPDDTYHRLVDALAALCGSAVDPDMIKTALGEIGDIWPMFVAIENLRDGLDRRGESISA